MRLYQQLAQAIKIKIQSGEFPAGVALPSERKLAELFDVSRASIRSAINLLTEEKLIETRRGSGSYVSERFSESFSSLTSLSEEATTRGMASDFKWLSREISIATPEEIFHLGIPPTSQITRVSRLREANNEPLATQTSTIVKEALPDPAVIEKSLYKAMAIKGKRPVRATQRITAVAITGKQAELLQVTDGSPGLQTWRVGYSREGNAVEYTVSIFRGDRWDFITELTISE